MLGAQDLFPHAIDFHLDHTQLIAAGQPLEQRGALFLLWTDVMPFLQGPGSSGQAEPRIWNALNLDLEKYIEQDILWHTAPCLVFTQGLKNSSVLWLNQLLSQEQLHPIWGPFTNWLLGKGYRWYLSDSTVYVHDFISEWTEILFIKWQKNNHYLNHHHQCQGRKDCPWGWWVSYRYCQWVIFHPHQLFISFKYK